MFTKISQLGKTFTDEISRINDEVNNQASNEQRQLTEPDIARRILDSNTPDISEITKPEDLKNTGSNANNQDFITKNEQTGDVQANDSCENKADSSSNIKNDDDDNNNNSSKEELVSKNYNPQGDQKPNDLIPGTQIRLSSLPPEIRSRLIKYFKYEKKYPQLYDAYKLEKKKTALIQAFENMLKEKTPCSSIGELNAVRDYLNGLENKGKMLTAELSKITVEKKDSDAEIMSLNQKVKDLQKALTSKKADETQELANLKSELTQMKEKNLVLSETTENYNKILNENKELQQEINQLKETTVNNEEIEKLNSENVDLHSKLQKSQEKNDELSFNFKKLEDEFNNFKIFHQNEKDSFEEQSKELTIKLSGLEKNLASTKKLNDLFREKVESLTNEKKEQINGSNTVSEQSARSKKSKNKNKNKNKNQKINSDSLEEPQNLKTTEIVEQSNIESTSSLSATKSSLEIEVIELRHKLEDAESSYNNEVSRYKILEKSLREKNDEIEELKDMVRDVGDSLVESQKLNKEQDDTDKLLAKAKGELEEKLNELEMLRLQNSNALTDYEKTKSSLTKKVDDLSNNIKDLESTLTKKNSELLLLQKKNDDFNSKTKDLEKLLSKLKTSEQQLQNQVKALTSEKITLVTEIESLKKHAADENSSKNEIQNLKTQISRKERILSDAESRIKFLQEEKSKINDSMIELRVQNKELKLHETSHQEIKDNLTKLNETLKSEIKDGSLRINQLSLENTKLMKKVEQLQDQYNEVKHIKLSSNDQIESFKKRVEELRMRTKEYENRIDMLQEELTQSRNMLQERTREMTTMRKLLMDNEEAQNSDRKELKSKFDRLLEEKEKSDNESLLTLRNKQREVDDLKRKNTDMTLKLEQLETLKTSLEGKLNESLISKSENVTNTRHSMMKSNSKSTSEENDYNSKIIESLRSSLEKTEVRIREIEDLNTKLRIANQDSSDKLIRMNKKYKLLSQQYKRRLSETSTPSSRNNSFVAVSDAALHPAVQNDDGTQDENEDIKEKSVYIKNVLLGFLEHKEQRQMLLPVIKMLLYMSDEDAKKLNELLV